VQDGTYGVGFQTDVNSGFTEAQLNAKYCGGTTPNPTN
jgi:hypothetical protein